ncbi:hypothetical protein EDI_241580 [Entamoeba dispar SAW760]|uniref:Uncharacterized protein n=1 Tax=Entamoeba dispar (strain ATCC PRA-260 / SAW760) TaxID=370354 RepID=B0E7R4_ENTDS|nr:uncharacterized protein EDI_241580 [Entamoeba dispar SAW760]EDR29425.1 hypothetical protein EDI_241580 [Entamoeba dispar SAW760]|eukprot:EDR29425.1 hypothetical protein EDI_241580 [Entamoeba dispar SAW760]
MKSFRSKGHNKIEFPPLQSSNSFDNQLDSIDSFIQSDKINKNEKKLYEIELLVHSYEWYSLLTSGELKQIDSVDMGKLRKTLVSNLQVAQLRRYLPLYEKKYDQNE